MQTIPAANNLYIQTDHGVWRLFTGQQIGQNTLPLIEASNHGLVYQEAFARARNLRASPLPGNLIEMVIVGWAAEDASWHLGVLFAPDYARERGSRWCGLVRWPDQSAMIDSETARLSGEALAETLGKPFRFVQPEPAAAAPVFANLDDEAEATRRIQPVSSETFATPAVIAELPDVARLAPPITIGEWTLTEGHGGLIWQHSRAWRVETLGRMIVFGALAMLFGLLSAGELRTNFASVQPEWLPIVGLIVTVIMAANALFQAAGLLLTHSVEFDRHRRVIRFVRRPRGVIKQVPFEKVENLLITHTNLKRVPVRSAESASTFDQIAAEVWLHITRDKGDFWEIGHVGQVEGRAVRMPAHMPRHPLHLGEIDTPAHQAAVLLAETMEVPVLSENAQGNG